MSGRGSRESGPDALVADGAAGSAFHGGLHLGPGDLAPDEERLLAALERDSAALHVDPIEDFVAGVRAARADTSPSIPLTAPDDGLTPLFTAPEDA
jgi:hypothetical protein